MPTSAVSALPSARQQANPAAHVVAPTAAARHEDAAPEAGMLLGPDADRHAAPDMLAVRRIRLRAGSALFRTGERCTALFRIRSGACTTMLTSTSGQPHVIGHRGAGDMLGIAGIAAKTYDCDAVASEDTEVYVFPYDHIQELCLDSCRFQQAFFSMLARETARDSAWARA